MDGTDAGRSSTSPGNVFVSTWTGASNQEWRFVYAYTGYEPYMTMGWTYVYQNASVYSEISSGYKRYSRQDHYAVDVVARTGTILGQEIRSVAPGVVTQAGFGSSSGYHVIVRTTSVYPNGNNLRVRYFHMEELLRVKANDPVVAGQLLGTTGWTGNVYPPGPGGTHLHFEVNNSNQDYSIPTANFVNPQRFFPGVFARRTSPIK